MNEKELSLEKGRDFNLFLISFLMLYFELLIIRYISSELRIFAYFNNLILIFCFLGIGLGCILWKKKEIYLLPFSIIFLLILISKIETPFGNFSFKLIHFYLSLGADFGIWSYGIEPRQIFLSFILGFLFLFLILAFVVFFFVPLGQTMAKLFNLYENLLKGYTINLLGSLLGIIFFTFMSYYSLPPYIWILIGGFLLLLVPKISIFEKIIFGFLTVLSAFISYERADYEKMVLWSPYQKLTLTNSYFFINNSKIKIGYIIYANNANYMSISNFSEDFKKKYPFLFDDFTLKYNIYQFPYLFKENPEDVLIVGSGAGNDVAGALRSGAKNITAVEIDKKIYELGKRYHPENPYSKGNVKIIIDDARSFFKKDKKKYDLIVFGLLDSHTLSSSYSNVRLDNFVYTIESFKEAKNLLKEDGMVFLNFYVEENYIGARLYKNFENAFGKPPFIFYIDETKLTYPGWCLVYAKDDVIKNVLSKDKVLSSIYEKSKHFSKIWENLKTIPSKDNWPYLYIKSRSLPKLYIMIYLIIILICFLFTRKIFTRKNKGYFVYFFLGAGFLLIEVQNVSKLALSFGTTWVTNTIAISFILIMIILANIYVIKFKFKNIKYYYVFLFSSIFLNFIIDLSFFSYLPNFLKVLSIGFITSLPIFFAGIIFSYNFEKASSPPFALSFNLVGAMLGGMSECFSFIFGMKFLLILAFAFYLISFLLNQRKYLPVTSN